MLSSQEPRDFSRGRFSSSIGRKLPAYATALGKALLYDYSEAELAQLLGTRLKPLTAHTFTNVHKLYLDIHRDAQNGFTYECEEITEHARCIARPLRLNGKIVAAISISFLVFNVTAEQVSQIKKILYRYTVIIEKFMRNKGFSY